MKIMDYKTGKVIEIDRSKDNSGKSEVKEEKKGFFDKKEVVVEEEATEEEE